MTKDRTLEDVKRKKPHFTKQRIYIKYKNLKVGLCEVACPFYVQKM